MRIRRLKLTNLRSVAEGEVVFPGHTVIIGGNSVGKSTLCEDRGAAGSGLDPSLDAEYDWTPRDLEHVSGARLEVKHYASLQPENPESKAWSEKPSFDIAACKGYRTLHGSWIGQFDRPADIYVLAWHPKMRESVVDHRTAEHRQQALCNEQPEHRHPGNGFG